MKNNNVYIYKIKEQPSIIRLKKSKFQNILNKNERDRIVKLYSKDKIMYNNPVVRLDNILEYPHLTLELSLIEFFDFISSNMINMNIDKFKKDCISSSKDVELLSKISMSIASDKIKSYKDIIDNSYLANIIAVSVLVEDKDGNLGFVKRGNKLAIGSGFLGVTCTGSLDNIDFFEDNPIISCVKRELKEELNIIPNGIEITNIIFSKTKLQPIFTVSCKIKERFADIINNIQNAVDYKIEIKNFYSVPKKYLKEFIKDEQLTDVAKWQIEEIIDNTPQSKDAIKKLNFKL